MPLRIRSSLDRESLPTRSIRIDRSIVTICETFATESRGRPVDLAVSRTLPGASAQRIVLVNGMDTTVLIALRLNESPWMTTTGRR